MEKKIGIDSGNIGGEKQVLVFLHYFGGSAKSWAEVTNLVSENYHCIALNLPGFGGNEKLKNISIESMANYVIDFIEGLHLKNIVLIGHSMGGKIAMQVAVNDVSKKAISRLILLAPSPPTFEAMPENEQLRMLKHPDREQSVTTVKNSTLLPLSNANLELGIETQLIADDETWNWWIKKGIHNSIATKVKNLILPITVIASKNDPAVTFKMTMDQTIPNLPQHTKLIETNNIGHLYPLENAEWLADVLKNILEN